MYEFLEYVKIRSMNFESIQRTTGKSNLRVLANVAFTLIRRSGESHCGYKRIASVLGESRELVRKWVRDYPMSEIELRDQSTKTVLESLLKGGGVLRALKGTPPGALSTPPTNQSVAELAALCLQAWDKLFNSEKPVHAALEVKQRAEKQSVDSIVTMKRRRKSENLFQ